MPDDETAVAVAEPEVSAPVVEEPKPAPSPKTGLTPEEKIAQVEEAVAEEGAKTEEPKEGEEESREAPTVTPWPDAFEKYKADDTFVKFMETELNRAHRAGQVDGHKTTDQVWSGLATSVNQANQGIGALNQRLEQAYSDGLLDKREVQRWIAEAVPALQQIANYNQQSTPLMQREQARYAGATLLLQLAHHPSINDPELGTRLANQYYDEYTIDQGQFVLGEMVDELSKRLEDKVRKPYEAKIRKLELALETGKGTARAGVGPAHATGGGVVSGRPTASQYAAATADQRREWKEKGIDPL